ncbi:uncharacterized protein LOC110452278 [Mizuhopecten yessoensis]|uniref:uncharacterized protein LOC110452278 n=1 Tax=Mizuhopecten yessoensis TaxID=6573 RepID=UPI000B45EC35|nr:uncharacterized protein LOC110452278 [Mizuhopecten yessoensis]
MLVLVSLIGYIWLISHLTEGQWIEEEITRVDNGQRSISLNLEDLEVLRRDMIGVSTDIAKLKAISGSPNTGQSIPDLIGDMLCSACSLLKDVAKRQKCRTRYCHRPSQSVIHRTFGGTYRNTRNYISGMRRRMVRQNNARMRRMQINNRY